MKVRLTAFVCLLLALPFLARADEKADSLRYAPLDSLLDRYYVALMPSETEEKCSEMDYLISVCPDSLVRQHVAQEAFRHYLGSMLMGEEAVALHLYDKWFASGVVGFDDEALEFEASMLSTFSRRSQLYLQAPVIKLRRPSGLRAKVPHEGHLSALFFYDTSCTKCKAFTALLPYSLEAFYQTHPDVSSKMDLVMVYTGQDRKAWKEFRQGFSIDAPVRLIHAWDPDISSDYQRMYDVTTTPRLFLVDKSGMIIGRRLEVDALVELLDYYYLYERNAEEMQ